MKLADFRLQLPSQLPDSLADRSRHLRHQQVGENAVFLWNVTLDRQARALFASKDDRAGDQLLADVLESDRRLVERHAELRRKSVQSVCRGHAARDATAATLAAQQIVQQESQDQVGRHVNAGLVADAEAIGIAVAREPQARTRATHLLAEMAHLLSPALPRLASKKRIRPVVQALER